MISAACLFSLSSFLRVFHHISRADRNKPEQILAIGQSKCPVCKGKMEKSQTDLTLRRGKSVVVIDEVPALVCENCGEAAIDSEVSQAAYNLAEKEIQQGVSLEFCKFSAA